MIHKSSDCNKGLNSNSQALIHLERRRNAINSLTGALLDICTELLHISIIKRVVFENDVEGPNKRSVFKK